MSETETNRVRVERACVYAYVQNGHTQIMCFIIYFLKQMRNFIFWVNLASLLDPLQFSQHPRKIIWNNWVATNIFTSLTGERKLHHSENIIYKHDLQHQSLSDTYSLTNMWNSNNTSIVNLAQGASLHFKSRFVQMITSYPCAMIRIVSYLLEFLWRGRHLEPALKNDLLYTATLIALSIQQMHKVQ